MKKLLSLTFSAESEDSESCWPQSPRPPCLQCPQDGSVTQHKRGRGLRGENAGAGLFVIFERQLHVSRRDGGAPPLSGGVFGCSCQCSVQGSPGSSGGVRLLARHPADLCAQPNPFCHGGRWRLVHIDLVFSDGKSGGRCHGSVVSWRSRHNVALRTCARPFWGASNSPRPFRGPFPRMRSCFLPRTWRRNSTLRCKHAGSPPDKEPLEWAGQAPLRQTKLGA